MRVRSTNPLIGGPVVISLALAAAGCAAPGPTLSTEPVAIYPTAELPGAAGPIEAPPIYAFPPPELVERIRVIEAQVALLKEIPPAAESAGVRRALVLLAAAMVDLPVPSPAAESAAALVESAIGDEVRVTDDRDMQMRIKRALQFAAGGFVVTAQGPYERYPAVLAAARRFQSAAERVDVSSQSNARREQVIAALDSAIAVLRTIAAPA